MLEGDYAEHTGWFRTWKKERNQNGIRATHKSQTSGTPPQDAECLGKPPDRVAIGSCIVGEIIDIQREWKGRGGRFSGWRNRLFRFVEIQGFLEWIR